MGDVASLPEGSAIMDELAREAAAGSNHTFLMGKVYGCSNWTSSLGTVGNYSVEYGASNSVFNSNVTVLGNIGIGLSNSAYPLHITSTGANNISIYSSGDISALSDARLKTDMKVIGNALDKIDEVHGYTFRWIKDADSMPTSRNAGVIAQEIERALPEVVTVDPITGDRHVAYANLSALLIQAIKELKERVIALESKLA
jgi:hypothetical protein